MITDELRALKEKYRFPETVWEGAVGHLLGCGKGVKGGLWDSLKGRPRSAMWVGIIWSTEEKNVLGRKT